VNDVLYQLSYSPLEVLYQKHSSCQALSGDNNSLCDRIHKADFLEATSGFEPLNNGFADRCLTTWLRRPGAEDGI
jgi:hypothetical protein